MTTNHSKHPSRHGAMPTEELASHPKVIHARERFIAPRATMAAVVTATIIRPDFREREKPRGTFAPPLKTLPFVKIKGGGRRGRPASYWKDAPTGNGRDDFKRGQKYAALTIAAIAADDCASWDLERIIEAMVIDAASRNAKGGKYSRSLPPAVDGFIHELSRQLCSSLTGRQP
jgi:hypothetical protein